MLHEREEFHSNVISKGSNSNLEDILLFTEEGVDGKGEGGGLGRLLFIFVTFQVETSIF